jgi:phenylalanyl-tRNA synthetase beta chain
MLAVSADDIRHEDLMFEKKEAKYSYQHLKNLNKIICGGKEIGEIGIVHPVVSKKIDKKASIVYAEIDMEIFASVADASISYSEPSRYPEIEIDLSFMSERFAPIGDAIKAENSDFIKGVSVVDTYTDENGKSITVRILFSHPERTLTKDETMEIVDSIVSRLESNGITMKQ